MFTSYAQNFEDVLLWRALGHIPQGFYIDIGAQDPVADSVSLAFYERGWRGVHVEPVAAYAQALREARPDEVVLQVAVGADDTLMPFFEFASTGLSTGNATTARGHEAIGFVQKQIEVPSVSLATILNHWQDRDIHWLKIDVEGMEEQVLRGWLPSTVKPWIVVVESTIPLTQTEAHANWEKALLDLGYICAWFDGLNRYYVAPEHHELMASFESPPNVFDNFTLSGTASNSFSDKLKSRLDDADLHVARLNLQQREVATLRAQAAASDEARAIADAQRLHAEERMQAASSDVLRAESRATVAGEETHRIGQLLEEANRSIAEQVDRHKQLELTLRGVVVQLEAKVALLEREVHHAGRLFEQASTHAQLIEQQHALHSADHTSWLRHAAERILNLERALAEAERNQSSTLALLDKRNAQDSDRAVALDRQVALNAVLLREAVENARTLGALERALDASQGELTKSQNALREAQRIAAQASQAQHQVGELTTAVEQLHRVVADRDSQLLSHDRASTAPQKALARLMKFASATLASVGLGRTPSGQVPEPLAGRSIPTDLSDVLVTTSLNTSIGKVTEMPRFSSGSEPGDSEWNLTNILAGTDSDFIEKAYKAVLNRPADPSGFEFLSDRLRRGMPRISALQQLMVSIEAKPRGDALHALTKEIDKHVATARSNSTSANARAVGVADSAHSMELEELLILNGEQFIDAAYSNLLLRAADESGNQFFLKSLRSGTPKIEILMQLSYSAEGRALAQNMPGLKRAIRDYRLSALPLIGTFWGHRQAMEGRAASDYRLRRMEQHLVQFAKDADQRTKAYAGNLGELSSRLDALTARLRDAQTSQEAPQSNSSVTKIHRSENPIQLELPQHRAGDVTAFLPGTIFYYSDHTAQCPINTGMQRVVRRLARSLHDQGKHLVFVKSSKVGNSLVLSSKEDLSHLSLWNGPLVTAPENNIYPYAADAEVPVEQAYGPDNWILVPEVTHITYHPEAVTLQVILAAQRLGLRTAFIYYDAIPLRLVDYKETAEKHERYMQHLLLADVVIPISNRSGEELNSFFQVFQENRSSVPEVVPTQLPAESQLASRETAIIVPSESTILCVGSIEPRKNQLAMLDAFEQICVEQPNTAWRLVLAGNLRADVAVAVMASVARNSRISHVQNISDADLNDLYRSCTFTVFPSLEEGFGLPILESLWYAKPCICIGSGAMAEVAQGGGCYLVEPGSTDSLKQAMLKLMLDPGLCRTLAREAICRPLKTWNDYSVEILRTLTHHQNPVTTAGRVYYWVDNTCINSSNSGIQRVTRQLAKALILLGVELIPVCWESGRQELRWLSENELTHLALWQGPLPQSWSPWRPPQPRQSKHGWLLIPELTHGTLAAVKKYADRHGLHCGAVFYDAIPYKLRSDYGPEFGENHRQYMHDLFSFDKVFPISRYAATDLMCAYLKDDQRSVALQQRISPLSLPGEFSGKARVESARLTTDPVVHILTVASVEPRKNLLRLLGAFEHAQQQSSVPLRLTIVGRRIDAFAGLAERLESRIARLSTVTWERDIDDVRLELLYGECDFTVFPSLEEGFGLPILESLWHGRPCICHRAGAMQEVASGGGCLLVDMASEAELVQAIVQLSSVPSLRRDLAGQAIARPFSKWQSYASSLVRELAHGASIGQLKQLPTPAQRIAFFKELINLRQRPKLSICISTYNRAGWLAVAMKNLVRLVPQPRDDVEIIVCDNYSSDSTPDVAAAYAEREDVKYIRNPANVGMLGNLRVTANNATGRYIWILGDDDLPLTGSIDRIIDAIDDHPETALIYLNYSYTRETDPLAAADLENFLNSGTVIAPATSDRYCGISEVATANENLFTAIYCLVFRRDHALRAYSQDTSGRPFSSMRTSIPTTYHALNHMAGESAVWLGTPQVLVNFNVSWNAYAALQILERIPEALDLAELMGAEPAGVDRLRANLIPGYVHYFKDIYGEDPLGNHEYFDALRVLSRVKHLMEFSAIRSEVAAIYSKAYEEGHPAAKLEPDMLFPLL